MALRLCCGTLNLFILKTSSRTAVSASQPSRVSVSVVCRAASARGSGWAPCWALACRVSALGRLCARVSSYGFTSRRPPARRDSSLTLSRDASGPSGPQRRAGAGRTWDETRDRPACAGSGQRLPSGPASGAHRSALRKPHAQQTAHGSTRVVRGPQDKRHGRGCRGAERCLARDSVWASAELCMKHNGVPAI